MTGQNRNVKAAELTFIIKSIKTTSNSTTRPRHGPEQRSGTSSSGQLLGCQEYVAAGAAGDGGDEGGGEVGGNRAEDVLLLPVLEV